MDIFLPRISASETKCILYICRRTFGFHKEYDRISFSQFVDGIKDRNGKTLDYGTGLVRSSVAEALRNLLYSEAILVKKSTKGNYYQINLHMDVDKVVRKMDWFRKQTKSGSKNGLISVRNTDPQKIGNKEKQSLSQSIGPPVDNRPEFLRLRAGLCDRLSLKNKTTNQTP